MLQINLIFRFLQSRQKVQIWLYEQNDLRIEGRIIVRPSLHGIVLTVASGLQSHTIMVLLDENFLTSVLYCRALTST